jgi:hypothetical protein
MVKDLAKQSMALNPNASRHATKIEYALNEYADLITLAKHKIVVPIISSLGFVAATKPSRSACQSWWLNL